MQRLLTFFDRLPIWARVLACLVVLAVLVVLSPLVAIVAVVVFLFSIVSLVVQLVRRRPVRRWGIAVGASLVAVLVFGGVSSALFPTNVEETASSAGENGGERAGREETGPSTTRGTPAASPASSAAPEETTSRGARGEEASSTAPEPGEAPALEPETGQTTGQKPSPEPGAAAQPESIPEPPPVREQPQPAAPAPQQSLAERGTVVTVTRAVDGDTVEVSPAVNGIEDVRLIGVDTPEVSSDCGTQPLADEATVFTRSQLAGQKVALELGSESTDRYGRLLAYVWTGAEASPGSPGSMFNTALLEEGYAQVYTVAPNDEYESRFLAAQQRAIDAGRGIWGLSYDQQLLQNERGNGIGGGCVAEPVPEPAPQPVPTPGPEPAAPPSPQPAPGPSGSGLPLFPGDPNGDLTCSDVPPGPYSVPPGSDRDRDSDGKACE